MAEIAPQGELVLRQKECLICARPSLCRNYGVSGLKRVTEGISCCSGDELRCVQDVFPTDDCRKTVVRVQERHQMHGTSHGADETVMQRMPTAEVPGTGDGVLSEVFRNSGSWQLVE